MEILAALIPRAALTVARCSGFGPVLRVWLKHRNVSGTNAPLVAGEGFGGGRAPLGCWTALISRRSETPHRSRACGRAWKAKTHGSSGSIPHLLLRSQPQLLSLWSGAEQRQVAFARQGSSHIKVLKRRLSPPSGEAEDEVACKGPNSDKTPNLSVEHGSAACRLIPRQQKTHLGLVFSSYSNTINFKTQSSSGKQKCT